MAKLQGPSGSAKTSALTKYNVRKHAIVDQTLGLIESLQAFEKQYSSHLSGKDLDDFSRVIVAIRNAGIMAISDIK